MKSCSVCLPATGENWQTTPYGLLNRTKRATLVRILQSCSLPGCRAFLRGRALARADASTEPISANVLPPQPPHFGDPIATYQYRAMETLEKAATVNSIMKNLPSSTWKKLPTLTPHHSGFSSKGGVRPPSVVGWCPARPCSRNRSRRLSQQISYVGSCLLHSSNR